MTPTDPPSEETPIADARAQPVAPLSYATPESLRRLDAVGRDGGLIVKPIGADLPLRCVRCNGAAAEYYRWSLRYVRSFRLAGMVRFRNLRVPLCARHQAWCRCWHLCARSVRVLAVVAMLVLLYSRQVHVPMLMGLLVGLGVATFAGAVAERTAPLRVAGLRDDALYLEGASRPYLATLPEVMRDHGGPSL